MEGLRLESTVDRVTVYRDSALVLRRAVCDPSQQERLIVPSLPLILRDDSVRVSLLGDPSRYVSEVQVGWDLGEDLYPEDPELLGQIAEAELGGRLLQIRRQFVEEEQKFLRNLSASRRNHPTKKGGVGVQAPMEGWFALLEFVQRRLEDLDQQLLDLEAQLQTNNEYQQELQMRWQMSSEQSRTAYRLPSKLLRLRLEETHNGSGSPPDHDADTAPKDKTDSKPDHGADSVPKGTSSAPEETASTKEVLLEISYQVPGACWVPTYDLRIVEEGRRAELVLQARVAQQTGEAWSHVEVSLSTADLHRVCELPQLSSLRLGRQQPEADRSGWRAPPEGTEALFEGYDQGMELLSEALAATQEQQRTQAPPPPPQAQPVTIASALAEPAIEEKRQNRTSGLTQAGTIEGRVYEEAKARLLQERQRMPAGGEEAERTMAGRWEADYPTTSTPAPPPSSGPGGFPRKRSQQVLEQANTGETSGERAEDKAATGAFETVTGAFKTVAGAFSPKEYGAASLDYEEDLWDDADATILPAPSFDTDEELEMDFLPESEMARGRGFFGGGGSSSKARAPKKKAKPRSRRAQAPGALEDLLRGGRPDLDLGDWLSYGGLRLAGIEQGRRGQLYQADLELLIAEAGGTQQDAFKTREVLQERLDKAQRLLNQPLPRGSLSIQESTDHFDHLYSCRGRSDIPHDGQFHLITIERQEAPLQRVYRTVPLVEPVVYREVRLQNPLEMPLLAGPAQIFWNNDYLLTTPLATVPAGGQLFLGLGEEERIRVSRNTSFQEETGGLFGGSLGLVHHIELEIRSQLPEDATVEILERIPVSQEKDIRLCEEQADPPAEAYDQTDRGHPLRGGRLWRIELQAHQRQTCRLSYRIDIPSRYEIVNGNRRV